MSREASYKILRRVARLSAICVAVGLVGSWFVAGKLIAPSQRSVGKPPEDLSARPFSILSESGSTISGWHTTASGRQGCVVLLHGIRQNRRSMLSRARLLDELGYSTVMIDMQAHGESDGDAITLGHLERLDVAAAVAYAKQQHPDTPIGLIGVSLGGAAALLASPLQIDALVLESVYSTIDDAVYNRVYEKVGPLAIVPTNLLLVQLNPRLGISRSQLRPIDRIPHAECPLLIISGAEDVQATATETRDMFNAALPPKELWIVPDAAHVDLLAKAPNEYRSRVSAFLRRNMHPVE